MKQNKDKKYKKHKDCPFNKSNGCNHKDCVFEK